MADYYTFGVVPADIGRYVPRFAFDTTSAPTLLQAADIIDDHAADLCAFLYGMGVAVQALNNNPTLAMYRTCQRYILLRFSAQAARLRTQNNVTLADALDEQADALMKRLGLCSTSDVSRMRLVKGWVRYSSFLARVTAT